jgi:GDP-L-fucose synthase
MSEKILLLGATGFLGKRLIKKFDNLKIKFVPISKSLGYDLRDLKQFEKVFADNTDAKIVFNAAAFVGGIQFGYKHPGEIYYNNSLINTYLFELAKSYGIKRIINPISNCSYPRDISTSFKESDWWNGELDESVFVYGFIRKASYVQSWAYYKQYGLETINLIVPNMYGPEDHFEPERSHALGAMIMRMFKAKQDGDDEFVVWGSGKPVREWLYIDDCADAMIRAIDIPYTEKPINIGIGYGVSIKELAEMIKKELNFAGRLVFDTLKPDGAPHKVMDITKCKEYFNWQPDTSLKDGIKKTIESYLNSRGR